MTKADIFHMFQDFRKWNRDWSLYDGGFIIHKPKSQIEFINQMFERYGEEETGPRYPDSTYKDEEISWLKVGDGMAWAYNKDLEKVTKRI